MHRLLGGRLYALAAVLLTGLAVALALAIALGTHYNAHPDEFVHVDAFCYFQLNGWLPPLDEPGLTYSIYGQSRVYSGEVVYWVYGRAAALAGLNSAEYAAAPGGLRGELQACQANYPVYRLFNVALLAGTLALLFALGWRHAWAAGLAVTLLALPQVIYTYAYANSDAWALSWSLALLVYALAAPRPLATWPRALLLGALGGLVLLSKESFWPAIPLALGLVGWQWLRDWQGGARPSLAPLAARLAGAVGLCLLIIAPLLIWYPLSQGGDLNAKLDAIRNERAGPGLQPANPYAAGFHLRAQGAPATKILLNTSWMQISAISFYGLFGYLDQRAPLWAYLLALALAAANGALTLAVSWRNWQVLPEPLRAALAAGPPFCVVLVLASMANSWMVDYQPQGRYLFLAVFPLALWLFGTLPWESRQLRAARLATAAIGVAMCAAVLWVSVVQNPVLM